jgi:elongation factor P
MLTTADFKKGLQILIDGTPYLIMDYTVQTPSARGAATLVRAKVRNILSGAVFDKTFKSGEKFDEPDVEEREAQFLYASGDEYQFMDQESFEQFTRTREELGEMVHFLAEQTLVKSILFNGVVVNIELPQFVEFEVTSVEPATRGDTATGKALKDASIATGATVKVPLYLNAGEKILVDTSTGEFVKRVR